MSPGDVLAQLGTDRRQARLDAAAATYSRVAAERAQAEARAERIAQLVEDGSASEQDYDDARFSAQALVAAENTAAAAGRIMDTDYAAETANLTKAQILQQAATSVLAQANAQPQAVLSLLQ